MREYSDYLLETAHTTDFDLYLICLHHESFLNYLEEIERDLQSKTGKLLIDQLTVTGNGKNRFITCDFKDGHIDLDSAKIIVPADSYRNHTSNILQSCTHLLENSILTDNEFEKVQNGQAI